MSRPPWDTPNRRFEIHKKLMARSHEEAAPPHLAPWRGPCRIWDGPTSGDGRGGGYGRMSLDGATVATHIASWVNENGMLPPRKQLDHLCRRRLCWAELHLESVSHKENQKRRAKWAALQADSSTAPAATHKRKPSRKPINSALSSSSKSALFNGPRHTAPALQVMIQSSRAPFRCERVE